MDNYEWQDAYSPESRFGLYQVNRNSPDFERIPTQAVNTLRLVIEKSNGVLLSDSAKSNESSINSEISNVPLVQQNTVILDNGTTAKGALDSPGDHTITQCNAGDQYHPFFNTLQDIILPPKYPDCNYFGKPWGEYGISRDEVINKINEDYNTQGFVDRA